MSFSNGSAIHGRITERRLSMRRTKTPIFSLYLFIFFSLSSHQDSTADYLYNRSSKVEGD